MHVLSGVLGASAPYAKAAAEGTAAAGAMGGAVATGAFKYNRANYMFDNELRFGRYTGGYSFAMTQASMYREDIRDMTALTVTKSDLYHIVGVIFLVLNFQLIMAGRLGVHGPSPPGWLMGLYWGNCCSSLMFLVFYTWLAMHSSARATAGGAHMLTRHVRLPIPTPKQLDKARKTGNSFERARGTDMFRIPFVAPAPKEGEGDIEQGSEKGSALKKRKIPRWHQNDEVAELHAGTGGPVPSRNATPDHFELYRGAQQEWFCHDAYSRISMFCFITHWLTAASLYTMCHAFGELRALWPAWSCTLLFCTSNRMIIACDIVSDGFRRSFAMPMEKIMPWVPMIAVLGMSLDYSVIAPSAGWEAVIYVLGWICYGIELAWVIRLFDLATPQKQEDEQPEAPGQPWWPSEWWLPPAFQNCLYLVAPPKRLEPGQTCLQQEMMAGRVSKAAAVPPNKAKGSMPALWPWKLFRGAVLTSLGMWVYMCIGRVAEQVNGERRFLKQEGRMERWPSHMQPWTTPWSRLGTRNEFCHTGGCDRRLMGVEAERQVAVASEAQRLASLLGPLADGLTGVAVAPALPPAPVQRVLRRSGVQWPNASAPPKLLASNGRHVAAMARAHKGLLSQLESQGAASVAFTLSGLEGLGELLGASWCDAGLLLTTASGALAECTGLPSDGRWPCQQIGVKLPMGGSSLATATAARDPKTGRLHAAVAFAGEDSSIALFKEGGDAAAWLPAGEVQMALPLGRAPYLSMSGAADELLVSTGDGGVLKWAIGVPEPVRVSSFEAPDPYSARTWNAVSSVGGNRLVHLLTSKGGGNDLMPELLLTTH